METDLITFNNHKANMTMKLNIMDKLIKFQYDQKVHDKFSTSTIPDTIYHVSLHAKTKENDRIHVFQTHAFN